MPADKCYCRPQRDALPRWPCEDASTAVKLCCLSATVYDVRCYWNTTTYQGESVDHSPGDVIGTGQNGDLLINCPETGYNTNLQGAAFFWFPDANQTDQVNPWRPCPQVCSTVRIDGIDYTNCMTGVQVYWSYSCDTGLVTFNSTWIFEPGGMPPSFLTFPSVGIVTVDPDWYLDNEIDIPYLTSGVNDNRPRFSLKLKLTCEPIQPCEPFACYPLCVANTCGSDPTINASLMFGTVTGDCPCLNGDFNIQWDSVNSWFYGSIGDPFVVSCYLLEVWYQCVSGNITRRVKITTGGRIYDDTQNVALTCDGSGNVEDTVTISSSVLLTPVCSNYPGVILDVYTNN